MLLAVVEGHLETPPLSLPGDHLLGSRRVTSRIKRLQLASTAEWLDCHHAEWPLWRGINKRFAVGKARLFEVTIDIERHTPTTLDKHLPRVSAVDLHVCADDRRFLVGAPAERR